MTHGTSYFVSSGILWRVNITPAASRNDVKVFSVDPNGIATGFIVRGPEADKFAPQFLLPVGVCAVRGYHFDYPFPLEAVVEFYRTNYGPVSLAFASLNRAFLKGKPARLSSSLTSQVTGSPMVILLYVAENE